MPKTAADAAEAVPDAVYKTAQAKKLTKNNKYPKNPFKEKSFEWIFLVKLKDLWGFTPNPENFFKKM
mgnify:CR=1 FL=1